MHAPPLRAPPAASPSTGPLRRGVASGRPARSGAALLSAALLAGALSLMGCEDRGERELEAARERYFTLIEEGVLPTDPRFDAVEARLEAIPEGSKGYADARRLLHALEQGRASRPRRPLVRATPGVTPRIDAQRTACAKLAQTLGAAEGEAERARVKEALVKCTDDLERLTAEIHEGQGHEGGAHEGPEGGPDDGSEGDQAESHEGHGHP